MCRHRDTGVLATIELVAGLPGPQSALVLQPTTQNFTGRIGTPRWSEFTDHGTSCGPPSRTQSVSLEQSPGPLGMRRSPRTLREYDT